MSIQRLLAAGGAASMAAAVALGAAGPASATFGGANGDLAWAAICISTQGQQIWAAPSTAKNLQCPSAPDTASSNSGTYTPVTAGAVDSMPYFSSDGRTVYFSSSRTASGQNAIFSVQYPNKVTSDGATPPNYSDQAVQLTNLSGTAGYDYGPTGSTDGTRLAWIRCTSASSGCSVWTGTLAGGVVTNPAQLVSETQPVAPPNNGTGNGDGSRPEINPAYPDQIVYVDSSSNIHLASISGNPLFGPGSPSDVNLSSHSVCPACVPSQQAAGAGAVDEHPDWSPDGSTLVYDSSRLANYTAPNNNQGTNNIPYTLRNLSAANPEADPVWNGIPSAAAGYSIIEPVYAPTPGTDFNSNPNQQISPSQPKGTPPTLAWIAVSRGSNVQTEVEDGTIGNPNVLISNTTANRTNNGEVIWQPVPPGQGLPESPLTIGLPVGAGAVLFGAAYVVNRRRSTRPAAA